MSFMVSHRLSQVTPLVLTFNEAPNIGRCLTQLGWADRVVVLDSNSTDETAQIARRFPNVEVHTRAFDDHATQWNHGLSLIQTPWALTLDADYVVPDSFPEDAQRFVGETAVDAVFARFRYCVFGRPLRASLYPPRAVLFRREKCRYEADGHTQRLAVTGRSEELASPFDHDDRKSFTRWLDSQNKYAALEVKKLLKPEGQLELQDRLRRSIILGPQATFFYTLILKGAMFDGWPGWYYAFQRTLAEVVLSLHLLDHKLRRD